MGMKKMWNSKKFITRMDFDKTHGWNVRWSTCGIWKKNMQSKLFSDSKYGGKRKALLAAKKFRNAKYKSLGLEELLDKRIKTKVRRHSKNTSGIIGVRRNSYKRDNKIYEEWTAHGCKNYEPWRKAFSIDKYGERGAFILACRTRYKKQGNIQIVCKFNELPFRPNVPYVLRGKK